MFIVPKFTFYYCFLLIFNNTVMNIAFSRPWIPQQKQRYSSAVFGSAVD
tara:strand:+ start:1010 stop:1156 length:147 start_codon:yes stop_codon:yes gene_type:complete